jgi:hypothetical protein
MVSFLDCLPSDDVAFRVDWDFLSFSITLLPSAGLPPGKFQCEIGFDNDFAVYLNNGFIDLPALLDTVGCRNTASK